MKKYHVSRLLQPAPMLGKWNAEPWRNIRSELLDSHMGSRPKHFPETRVKIAYDDEAIYVIFRVKDRYVRAVHQDCQSSVWKDSCVEFFFTPGMDVKKGYFNLEMNCSGAFLFNFQRRPRRNPVAISPGDCRCIRSWHSIRRLVKREIRKPVTWIVEYSIPFSILEEYCRIVRPRSGSSWRANFNKIAAETSHPHWLTWSPVKSPKPDFHLPAFFGILKF